MSLPAHKRPDVDRDRAMVAMYLAGVPIKQFAPSATSTEQVRRAIIRAGIAWRRRDTPPDWWDDAAQLRAGGHPIAHIARYCGVSRRAAQKALSRLGLR